MTYKGCLEDNDCNMTETGSEGEGDVRLKGSVGKGKPRNLKRRIAGAAAGVGLLGTAILGGRELISENSENLGFGEPTTAPFVVDLLSITNSQQETLPPTFRENAKQSSRELTLEELNERGIDLSSNSTTIREVKGSTYPGGMQGGGQVQGENGKEYGVWGEIMIPDANGELQPTGIYMSKNFYAPQEQPQAPQGE